MFERFSLCKLVPTGLGPLIHFLYFLFYSIIDLVFETGSPISLTSNSAKADLEFLILLHPLSEH